MIVWRPWEQEAAGIEVLEFDGREARGTMIRMRDDGPLRIDYSVSVDAEWHARKFTAQSRGREVSLDLNGDVDLWACAFTNTLPIRRMNWADVIETTMPYVTGDLRVEEATQRYTRIDARTYRFESMTSGFSANIIFDEEGLVFDYEKVVRRVWPR